MLFVHQALCHMHKKQRAALLMFLALSPMVGCKGRSTRQKPPILPAKAKRIVTSGYTSSAVTYPVTQALSSSSSTAKPARWPVLERIESLTAAFENKGNSPAYLFDALQKLLVDLSAYKDDYSFTQNEVVTVNACIRAVCSGLYDIDKKAEYQALCRRFFGVEGRASINKIKSVLPGSTLDTFLRLLTTSPGKPKRTDIEKLITKLVGYAYYIACSDDNPDAHEVLVEPIIVRSGRISSTEPVNSYVDLSHLQDSKEYKHRFYPFKAGKKGLEIDKKVAPLYSAVDIELYDSISPQPVALPEEVVQPTEEPEAEAETLGEVGKETLEEAHQPDTTAKTSTLEVGGQIVTPPSPGSYEELCTLMRENSAFKDYVAELGLDLNELTNDVDSPGRTEALVIGVRKLVQKIQSDPNFTKQKPPKGLYAILLRMIAQLPAEAIKQRTKEMPASLLDNLYQAFRKQKRNIPIPMVPSKKFANYADQLDLLNLAIIKSRVEFSYKLRADKTCDIGDFVYKHGAPEKKTSSWLDMGLLSSDEEEEYAALYTEVARTAAFAEGL